MWFQIKVAENVTNGPHHVLHQIKLVRKYTNKVVMNIVKPRIESSAWFAHPEHILLSLLTSQDETERRFTVKIIMQKIRNKDGRGDNSVRVYKLPSLNWQADKLLELIDWEDTVLTEPALTASLSSNKVNGCLDSPLEKPAWPCHGQCVERTVKKVSEASKMVVGQEKRDGWIRAADSSRKKLPKLETKKDYLKLFN